MSKPWRVLVITPFLWSGAGKAIIRLIRELKSKGFDFELISSGRSRGQKDWPEYVRALLELKVPYYTIDFFDRTSEIIWESINKLTGFIQTHDVDMVHVHAGVPAFAAAAVRDRLGADFPILATFHSWNPDRPVWMNHADIWALNRCDCVVADSHSYQELLQEWGLHQKRSRTIRLGIDMPEPVHSDGADRRRLFQILSVGRIEPRKDQETLLRGFSLFRKRFPDSRLSLAGPVGNGDYHRNLMKKARRYGWLEGVRILGKVKNTDALYKKSDLFISASKDEGLGLAVLEAMSYGLGVICTPVAGHRDFVENGVNSRVIPVGDAVSLSQAIRELHEDKETRLNYGTQARRMVSSKFTWSATANRYCEVYRELLAGKRNIWSKTNIHPSLVHAGSRRTGQ